MAQLSLDKHHIRFLLLEGIHPNAVNILNKAGYNQIESISTALEPDELIEKIKDVHFLGIRSRTQLNQAVLEQANKLVAVGCFCIGTNQVDVETALSLGIPVFIAPYSNTRSVAELVLAQAVLLLRRVPEMHAGIKQGNWNKSAKNANEARGKTLGIIGYGSIGSQLSILAESLGMRVIYYDVLTKLPMGNAKQVDSLNHLLQQADVVTLHVPDLPSTRQMMGQQQFAMMKPGSVFINAARGGCVDIDALCQALDSGHLRGAAVDVFPIEPKANGEALDSPLVQFDQVLLTPHIGGSTQEAQANIGLEVAEKLVKYSDAGSTTTAVNFPEVSIPATQGTHRLLHIHQNVPGILSQINTLFAQSGINVSAQNLMTKGEIGYLVMDVDECDSKTALSQLKTINGTLRARVLF